MYGSRLSKIRRILEMVSGDIMKDWKKVLASPEASLVEIIKIIDEGATGIALIVDSSEHLLGTITDGDIRRAILQGISLTEVASSIMNTRPTVARINDDREAILTPMCQKGIKQVPIVDENGKVVFLEVLSEMIKSVKRKNWVVLMAGGKGQRLRPLTTECPKPLLKVGGKPILETIIENFIQYGFTQFYISVNYKADMIEKYFGDGTKMGININYLRESEQLGTAGALSLLPDIPEEPILVMNGDLLTKVNFAHLLEFHKECRTVSTMCVREYKVQVPYGVVQLDKHRLTGIVEKPIQQFFVSAGVYVLDPTVIKAIPKNQFLDMPTIFEELIHRDNKPAVFPVREYWIDIGQMPDFEKANVEFAEVFL